tara:strand:+ start:4019 stop:4927 length:909 start_codon:yes stop_codon:yes gene_type:complete
MNNYSTDKLINIAAFTHKVPRIAKNFGDAVSKPFWKIISQCDINIKNIITDKSPAYLTIGSILKLSNSNSTIIGTGFICEDDDLGTGNWGERNSRVDSIPLKILSVRGPRTRNKLINMKIDCPTNYGDPLIIMPLVYNKKNHTKRYDIGIIPHYIDYNSKSVNNMMDKFRSNKKKVIKIDILCGQNYKSFIDKILECEYIISSSLHGVMMGIVYGKKTIWTEFSDKVFGERFKFYDFLESIDIHNHECTNKNNSKILKQYIKVNPYILKKTGSDIINICPFIDINRKKNLDRIWRNHCNKLT